MKRGGARRGAGRKPNKIRPVRIELRLPPIVADWLRARADSLGIPRTKLICMLVRYHSLTVDLAARRRIGRLPR